MSKIIDAMERAELMRELSRASTNDPAVSKKTIPWLTLLPVWAICIAVIIFYLQYNQLQELNLISDQLGQVEYKLAQIVDKQSVIESSIALLNQPAPELSAVPTTIPVKTTSVIKETALEHPKEITKPAGKYHVVKTGETLYNITKRYGKSVDEIRRLNSLKQNQHIKPGQKIMITQIQR